MHAAEIIEYIIIPLSIFLLTAAGAGVTGLIKIMSGLTESNEAQKSTACSNERIATQLEAFMSKTDGTLQDHGQRISVLEYAESIRPRRHSKDADDE